jgi:hypothetical protein
MGNPYNGFTWEERREAYEWWKAEVAAGRRTWPTVCDACGQTEGRIEPHDEDYSKPYGPHICEFGVCHRCHMMIHRRFQWPRSWDRYRAAVRARKPARLLLDEIHSGKWLNRGCPAVTAVL